PANIDLDVPPNCKARVLQALRECRYSRVTFRIICRAVHQHADVLHSFGLLRARRKRPGGRRSCNNFDEVSPAHVTISSKAKDYARNPSISDRDTAVREGKCPLYG